MSKQDLYTLYHLRNIETSSGPGNDGYLGITKDPLRRRKEHFGLLARNKHPNSKLQAEYNLSPHAWSMGFGARGSKEEILCRERLMVDRPNKHLNLQVGGGGLRGISKEEATSRMITLTREREAQERRVQGKALKNADSTIRQNSNASGTMAAMAAAACTPVGIAIIAGTCIAGYFLYKHVKSKAQ